MPPAFKIDSSEVFDHLPGAPIKEAILEFRARAMTDWDQTVIKEELAQKLPDYPNHQVEREIEGIVKVPESADPPEPVFKDVGRGFRCSQPDGLQFGRFLFHRFSFNRLAPYLNWDAFVGEAIRLWQVHTGISQPADIQRIGLRYINQVEVPPKGDLDDIFIGVPDNLPGLGFSLGEFVYQQTAAVPGSPYAVRALRTLIPANEATDAPPRVVLDIDVFSTQPTEIEKNTIQRQLAEMRWLKNKVFFGTFKPEIIAKFKEATE